MQLNYICLWNKHWFTASGECAFIFKYVYVRSFVFACNFVRSENSSPVNIFSSINVFTKPQCDCEHSITAKVSPLWATDVFISISITVGVWLVLDSVFTVLLHSQKKPNTMKTFSVLYTLMYKLVVMLISFLFLRVAFLCNLAKSYLLFTKQNVYNA